MTLVLLIVLGAATGLLLGALGGGGAVLAVPALVFLVGQDPGAATTSSLVVVAAAAVTGAVSHVRSGGVAWRTGTALGLASVPAAWAGSQLNQAVPASVLLVSFAVLMLGAAGAMVRDPGLGDGDQPPSVPRPTDQPPEHHQSPAHGGPEAPAAATRTRVGDERRTGHGRRGQHGWLTVLAAGLGVGGLTGFLGVGGGFVVVPVLVLALGLSMGRAVGTSLVVVTIASSGALLARAPLGDLDASVVVPFATAAVVATLLGRRVADRLPARHLQRVFVALLVLVAGYTLVRGLAG